MMEEIILKKDKKFMSGMTALKGTRLFVLARIKRPESMGGGTTIAVAIDNGTGQQDLMPKDSFIELRSD